MKKTTARNNSMLAIEDKAQTEKALQALLKASTTDSHARKMITLALAGLSANVPRMTPEEISAYLGRER